MTLTQDQIDTFHRNGFLRYGPVLQADALDTLREAYDWVLEDAERRRTGRDLISADDPAATGTGDGQTGAAVAERTRVFQVMQCGSRHIAFRRLWYHQLILDVVSDLMGSNIMLFHDQALFKPPHTGGPVPWHQDNAYWNCRPANLVSCWLTLDDVTRENGAMQLIPGSHLTPVWHEDHREQDTHTLQEIPGVDASQAEVVDLPAGGCLFHHCQTLHYTQPNTTDRQRRALAMHFMPVGTRQQRPNGELEVMHPSFDRPILRACV